MASAGALIRRRDTAALADRGCGAAGRSHMIEADQHLQVLRTKGDLMAEQSTETQVLDLLAKMTADSLEASSLDAQTLMLVRIAALVAVGRAAGLVSVEPRSRW
jgi:hypothetical protein